MTQLPDDTAAWQTARTITDLGELTAQFLEGRLSISPTHLGPPDPETSPLIAVLAAVNRAGFVTECSQPGIPPDEDGWTQRADISGFVSSETFARLMTAVAGADLIITAVRTSSERSGPFYPITLHQGEENTWDGGAQSAEDIAFSYGPWCHPQVVEELTRAWQVTLIDPQWGRNDALWPLLAGFAQGPNP